MADPSQNNGGSHLRQIHRLEAQASTAETDITALEAADVAIEARLDALELDPAFMATFAGNAEVTTITTQSVAVRFGLGSASAEVFVAPISTLFTLAGAELQLQEVTYDGVETRLFRVRCTVQATSAAGEVLEFAIQKNESTIAVSEKATTVATATTAAETEVIVSLATADDLQLVAANETNTTNLTIISAMWTITPV